MNIPILTFPKLLKNIRKEANLTQNDFAKKLGVSKILIAMIETESREPSKKFVQTLANNLDVNPFVLMPFLNNTEVNNFEDLSFIEKQFLKTGVRLQNMLIKKKSKLLRD